MNPINPSVQIVSPRQDVYVNLPNQATLAAPIGTSLETILLDAEKLALVQYHAPLIAAIVDGKLRELSYQVKRDVNVIPLTLASSDGGRIYRRSLVLLLTTAIDELFPKTEVNISYAVRDGGYYCKLTNRPALSAEELVLVDQRMREIIAADAPIGKRLVSLEAAQKLFAERGDTDKVRLLEYRTSDTLTLYSLRGRDDYYFGYMMPSARELGIYKLIHAGDGFILQYPRKENPLELMELHLNEKLSVVFKQSDEWLAKLELEDIGRLNHLVRNDKIQELILVTEALHEQNVATIATEVEKRHHEGVRIILIAGPSSSGKTTFSKRLAIQLLAQGLKPFTLEMDNYFVDRPLTPRDENGDYDFESLLALNRDLLNQHLLGLMKGEQVQLPRFNFHFGRSESGRVVQLQANQIIILEGIHGMNPDLVPQIPNENIYRIYVSALTQLNIDSHNRVPTTDVRLLRRIVRDARSRGYNATDTLLRWQSVRNGEKRNIFPYQENADAMFNSALVYELAALRPLAEPLLLQVTPNTPAHLEANRLLSFLRWVVPLNPKQTELIPDTSLLREFIGGSILDSYHPGSETTES